MFSNQRISHGMEKSNMNKNNEILFKFGEFMIKKARDPSIYELNMLLENISSRPALENFCKELSQLSDERKGPILDFIIEIVDTTLNNFLWVFEQEDTFKISYTSKEEKFNISEISDGLCGDYWGFIHQNSSYKSFF
jgi:hypothetical protein